MKFFLSLVLSGITLFSVGQDEAKINYKSLKWRTVGPALTSGRIADLAVHPNNPNTYYVAVASGGVWKTENHGVTFNPIFDNYGSYSIGCVTIDPNNPNTIWVGTGENNNQRSVAYGDGIYKSVDGGKSFKNMGLKSSEHIGMIKVHPNNSQKIFVAAYGPLWSEGGDRGIYLSEDGGTNWTPVLQVSEHTGFNEIHFDPKNPNILYATAHQRRRHVFTYISGGPESNIYKSEDGGKTWRILKSGIPNSDKGRIALSISPSNPNILYAMIEGHGTFKSSDKGESFQKVNDYASSGNYYVELVPHPHNENIVYSMDTYAHLSMDGGKTFKRVPEAGKHVDNHCLWINPKDPNNMIMGCDGGLYETWDNANNWQYKPNLPVTQFYKVATDNATPFYNIYGGTQDNFSLGGPSRTINQRGIINEDWFVTNTGDGFESQVDPTNPNIVYAQAQYGWLVRFDRLSGETTPIQPQPKKDEKPFRWNWDAPLLISPHDPNTLYFAANIVFRSPDRGNSWERISEDLSQEIDRDQLPVMGKVWGADAIAKHKSTTIYGNIVALNESPLKKGLLYAGTDDGLIHVMTGEGNWKEYNSFSDVPKNTYVNAITPSSHDENVVYAAFNNHKNGDFKPYLLKSTNQGKSWKSISGNLPERGSVYAIAEDHENPDLLFAGTEFGVFVSQDGGKDWKPLNGGLPTVAVRDIDIQKRENDLVIATFGRGFYVLDDYSPLRDDVNLQEEQAYLFDIKDGLLFNLAHPLGYNPPGFQGAAYYMAPNPPQGVTFTYYTAGAPKGPKATRKEKEKEEGYYPSKEDLRAEDREESNYLLFIIKTEGGQEVARFTKPYGEGIQRVTWDGYFSSMNTVRSNNDPLTNPSNSFMAPPGNYAVSISAFANGELQFTSKEKAFTIKHLDNTTEKPNAQDLLAFRNQVEKTQGDLNHLNQKFNKAKKDLALVKAAYRNLPNLPIEKLNEVRKMELQLADMNLKLNGDSKMEARSYPTKPGVNSKMGLTKWSSYGNRSATTQIQKNALEEVKVDIQTLTGELNPVEAFIQAAKKEIEDAGGPIIP